MTSLARRFQVDHTSIIYQCKKYSIFRFCPLPNDLDEHIEINTRGYIADDELFIKPHTTPSKKDKYDSILYDKINNGKSYKEYLKDSKMNELKKYFK